jgi:hypothetical protein
MPHLHPKLNPTAFAATHDFYVRTTMRSLTSTRFTHLFSYMDDGLTEDDRRMGMPVTAGGYTEWANETEPALSIGWDWYRLHTANSTLLGPGEIRSNIMLLDQIGYDHGPVPTERLLRCWVASLHWQAVVDSAISAGTSVTHFA